MNPAIFAKVAGILADQLAVDLETVFAGSSLESLGMDSMDLVEITIEIEEEFDLSVITDEEMESWKTVADIVLCVEGKGVAA